VTLSKSVYWTLYAAGIGWASLLAINYRSLWDRKRKEIGDEIRSFNAKNGYNQSVGREKLARALLNPFSTKALEDFSKNNDIEYSSYHAKLRRNIDTIMHLRLVAGIFAAGIILSLFGLSNISSQSLISREFYIILLYLTLGVNTILYAYV